MKSKVTGISFLFISAFVEGAALMAVEMLSSKMIAPYYGSSLYVWASIIGMTMGGLAIGYFLGGVLSERKINTVNKLMILFVAASLLLFFMPSLSSWIMEATLPLEIRAGIFLSCFIFMLPTMVCFGMVSPIIIRLLASDAVRIGFSSGIVYTISTVGGIIFTFLTGFYFISSFGVKGCAQLIGSLLILLPLFNFVKIIFFKKTPPVKGRRNILWLGLLIVLLTACKEKNYTGTCTLHGTITNYKNTRLALYEITQSQNYLISKIDINSSGKFKLKFTAPEKSIYGITNGRDFIYFVNDAPELSVETSEDEFENYFVEDSPESEQLRQLVATDKKLATEVTLAEKLLISKMVKRSAKFGKDPEILDLENKADKRSLELRTFVTNYMDTVHDKLLATAASSFLLMNEDFNYLELFYKKIENTGISKRQKDDLKIELDKMRRSFKSIAPVTWIKGIGRDGKPQQINDLGGKYVFVNIWASWCYLSRMQIPFLKKAYDKFREDPNIEFVNIAIDDDLSGWNTFLANEKYDIKHNVCDTLGKDAAILKRFGLDYIPANFLLDRSGSIITSNMRDDNIVLTLDSILKSGK